MKKKKTTTRIVLDLEDDEFLELGGLGYSIDSWQGVDPKTVPFGRMALKVKSEIEKKATPGQRDHLEKLVFALQEVARNNKKGVNNLAESFGNYIGDISDAMDELT